MTMNIDPFDCLPTDMPLKSNQLLDQFLHAHKSECSTPLSKFSLARALQTKSSFSSLLLLAALHYSWNTGHLNEYETTYLAHKIRCLQTINEFIRNPRRDPRGLRGRLIAIATLCLTDAGTGNLQAAETHLDGLTALLDGNDAVQSPNQPENKEEQTDDLILQRYILICIMEIARMRHERGHGDDAPRVNVDLAKTDASLGAVMPLNELEDRLAGFWLMPYFVATENLTCAEIDGANHLNNLRFLTATYGGCQPSSLPTGLRDQMTQGWGRSAAGMKSYFMQGVAEMHVKGLSPTVSSELASFPGSNTHSTSIATATSPDNSHTANNPLSNDKRYAMSWVSLTITSGFYLYAVLNLGTSVDSPSIRGRPQLWMIRTLQREIDVSYKLLIIHQQHSNVAYENKRSPELFLWSLFMGAVTVAGIRYIAATSTGMESSLPGGEKTFQELEAWFAVRMRKWSEYTGVTAWEGEGGARDVLAAVVWPTQSKVEPLAKAIWETATSNRP